MGKNTQQHIHDGLIELAKEILTITALSVSEIAYQLGFGHPQAFSKVFKNQDQPVAFGMPASFNYQFPFMIWHYAQEAVFAKAPLWGF